MDVDITPNDELRSATQQFVSWKIKPTKIGGNWWQDELCKNTGQILVGYHPHKYNGRYNQEEWDILAYKNNKSGIRWRYARELRCGDIWTFHTIILNLSIYASFQTLPGGQETLMEILESSLELARLLSHQRIRAEQQDCLNRHPECTRRRP